MIKTQQDNRVKYVKHLLVFTLGSLIQTQFTMDIFYPCTIRVKFPLESAVLGYNSTKKGYMFNLTL